MLGVISVVFIVLVIYQTCLIIKYRHIYKNEISHIATLTHDLKSPTFAQINMLDLILKGKFGQLNSEQYEMLSLTRNSAKYVSCLIGTILSDYKNKSMPVDLNKSYFDFVILINSVLKRYECTIKDKELKIVFNHNECLKIYADELQIERVISNLISNATIYSFKRSVITINLSSNKNFVNFSISNKSYFISQKELKNIFNKYSKTENSKHNKASTGLGLYTSKQLISLHGGQIYAKSSKDGTCTFGFRLKNKIPLVDLATK